MVIGRNGLLIGASRPRGVGPVGDSYFEAGTASHNYVSGDWSPTTDITFSGTYATIDNPSAIDRESACSKQGTVTSFYVETTYEVDRGGTYFYCYPIAHNTSNRIQVTMTGGGNLSISAFVAGSSDSANTPARAPVAGDYVIVSGTVTGEDVDITAEMYDSTDSLVASLTRSITGGYNSALDYKAWLTAYQAKQRYDKIRVEGYGFPNPL